MLRKQLAIVGLTGALLGWAGRAHGQNQTEAEGLFAQGRDLLEKGQLAEACAKLKRSEELAPAAGTLLNLGYCWEQLGRFRSAMEAYSEAQVLAQNGGDPKRSTFAKERLTAVEARVMKMVILVTPPAAPDLEVRRNGAIVPKTDWGQSIAIDPEEVVVTATAPGRLPWKGVVMGRGEGATLTVFVPPLLDAGHRGQRGAPLGGRRIAALALGGGAVAAIGAGFATALGARARYDDSLAHCDAAGCDSVGVDIQRRALTQGNVATALLGLGLLFAGAGTYLWLVSGEPRAGALGATF